MKAFQLVLIILLCCIGQTAVAQELEKTVKERLETFFKNYTTVQTNIGTVLLESFNLNNQKRTLDIYANENFGYQPFNEENVKAIYRTVKQSLPGPVNYYKIRIFADNRPIEELIPNVLLKRKAQDKDKLWGDINYQDAPWVKNQSLP